MKLSKGLLALALLPFSPLGVQASSFAQLSGTNVDFYYDQEFWGVGTATVLGNTISFNVSDFSTTARVHSLHGQASATLQDTASPGLVVVAKSGYTLKQAATQVGGSYAVPASGGFGQIQSYYDLYAGSLVGNSFSPGEMVGYGYSFGIVQSNGAASIGSFSPSSNAYYTGAPRGQNTLGLATTLSSWTNQAGLGSSTATLGTASYSFDASPPAVPEPARSLMLLVGLSLIGAVARRAAAS